MPNETDYAWAAGIIDGEGSITMTCNAPGHNRRITYGFQIRISVRMTHEATVKRLHTLFGGTFTSAKAKSIKHKDGFGWYVGDLKTVDVLKKTMRYMVTKREQARLVLEFRETCFNHDPHMACGADLELLRISYFLRLQKLNRKGPDPDLAL